MTITDIEVYYMASPENNGYTMQDCMGMVYKLKDISRLKSNYKYDIMDDNIVFKIKPRDNTTFSFKVENTYQELQDYGGIPNDPNLVKLREEPFVSYLEKMPKGSLMIFLSYVSPYTANVETLRGQLEL